MEDRWAKLEEIVRKVVREELSTWSPQKAKSKIGFKHGLFTGLGEIEIAALEAAYPAVDIKAEIKQAAAWIITHHEDAPRSNFGAFLNTWLRKHQNQHSLRSVPAQREEIKKKACSYCSSDATGSTSGILHCSLHTHEAMDGKPRRMLGIVPKPVAGSD